MTYKTFTLAFFAALQATPSVALESTNPLLVENFTQVFDAKNHDKARNINLTVKYPKNWVAQEARSPLIVQKFISTTPLDHPELMIQIRQFAIVNSEESCRNTTVEEFRREMETLKMKTSEIKKIEVKNRPAILMTQTQNIKSGSYSAAVAIRSVSICYKDKMVGLACIIGDSGGTEDSALRRLNVFDKLCNNFFELAELQ